MIPIKVFKCKPTVLPEYQSEEAACCDLRVAEIEKRLDRVICHTGLKVEIPEGYRITLYPRSSISKTDYYIPNSPGIIDSDYRGEILVVFKKRNNNCFDDFPYKVGERCAQISIDEVFEIAWEEVNDEEDLTRTKRGEGGYGSTMNL